MLFLKFICATYVHKCMHKLNLYYLVVGRARIVASPATETDGEVAMSFVFAFFFSVRNATKKRRPAPQHTNAARTLNNSG